MSDSSKFLFDTINLASMKRIAFIEDKHGLRETELSDKDFRVYWKDLTYTASRGLINKTTKVILNGVSGYFQTGQITGIMGPSGCGKSTLLNCLAGHNKSGLNGSIFISNDIKVKFAFIVQENHLLSRLTVREAMIYASKLKNGSKADHKLIANNVIDQLMLQSCADNYPKGCSGGQQKRVLIGLEMVSKPNILILDEPTSGLDSVTAFQLINTLIDLTKEAEPVSVLLTIHQPSAKLFNLFDKIYLLSCEGQCIYYGSPQNMIRVFNEVGLNCPRFTNISDYALEVASNDYGRSKLLTLSTISRIEALNWSESGFPVTVDHNYNTITDIWHLTMRSIYTVVRDPSNFHFRIFGYIYGAVIISIMYGPTVGQLSACAHDVVINPGENMFEKWKDLATRLFDNLCLLGFTSQFAWFVGIFITTLSFPMEINVFKQEQGNGYYSGFSYFISKVLSDLLFNLTLPILGALPLFLMTSQYWESMWRLIAFNVNFIILSLNSSALGFLIGTILADHPSSVAFVGMLSIVPLLLLSGLMIPKDQMPLLFQWLTYGDYLYFGFRSFIIIVYGFDRCIQTRVETNQSLSTDDWLYTIPSDKMIEILNSDKIDVELIMKSVDVLTNGLDLKENESYVLRVWNLTDQDYYWAIVFSLIHLIVYRVLAYLFILRRTKK